MHPARTLVVALSLPLAAQAQDRPHDRFGEPVPAPAVQRLGGPSSSQPTSHLAYSPDGKLLAASQGQGLMLWDRRGEAVTRVLIAPDAEPRTRVAGVAFSRDGALLIVGTGDGALRALDPSTGAVVRTYTTFSKPADSTSARIFLRCRRRLHMALLHSLHLGWRTGLVFWLLQAGQRAS